MSFTVGKQVNQTEIIIVLIYLGFKVILNTASQENTKSKLVIILQLNSGKDFSKVSGRSFLGFLKVKFLKLNDLVIAQTPNVV